MCRHFLLACLLAALLPLPGYGQAVRTEPYNAQLRSDPAVGNVQGIQRYGRPLKTDPDEGEVFSYHVYPVADSPGLLFPGAASQEGAVGTGRDAAAVARLAPDLPPEQGLLEQLDARVQAKTQELVTARKALETATPNKNEAGIKGLQDEVKARKAELEALKENRDRLAKSLEAAHKSLVQGAAEVQGLVPVGPMPSFLVPVPAPVAPVGPPGIPFPTVPAPAIPYPPPFNPTLGMRLAHPPPPVPTLAAGAPVVAGQPPPLPPVEYQPLIQVKMRVVEVDRADQLLVSSVLDIIRQPFAVKPNTLITGDNVNHDRRDLSAGTRFPLPDDLITFTGKTLASLTGSGALVNLTEGNLNYIARLLATEFQADIITAPEVVTINGQNVEFVSGQKVPFSLGQNVIQGNNNNIQQFFYKHVGTYVSVTPRIVSWGPLAGGSGKAHLVETDIVDWASFVRQALFLNHKHVIALQKDYSYVEHMLATGPPDVPVSIDVREALLDDLKRYTREDLIRFGLPIVANTPPAGGCVPGCGPGGCEWHASDCTIDLEVIVRLSDLGSVTLSVSPAGSAPQSVNVTSENNVRAIADILQVQSGHGVVMGGLIGERDVQTVNKVPVLGDIPGVGVFFRSKATDREKTEVLVFIEAKVLDPCPSLARAQSAHDFPLGHAYVDGEFLDNPLEFGMYRAGFGSYLPPHSLEEKVFWERLGRKVRKVATELDDTFE